MDQQRGAGSEDDEDIIINLRIKTNDLTNWIVCSANNSPEQNANETIVKKAPSKLPQNSKILQNKFSSKENVTTQTSTMLKRVNTPEHLPKRTISSRTSNKVNKPSTPRCNSQKETFVNKKSLSNEALANTKEPNLDTEIKREASVHECFVENTNLDDGLNQYRWNLNDEQFEKDEGISEASSKISLDSESNIFDQTLVIDQENYREICTIENIYHNLGKSKGIQFGWSVTGGKYTYNIGMDYNEGCELLKRLNVLPSLLKLPPRCRVSFSQGNYKGNRILLLKLWDESGQKTNTIEKSVRYLISCGPKQFSSIKTKYGKDPLGIETA